ncbi:Inositol polyphosphate 5-phosphatase OCRL [Lamellibrachia satsuma]|nr:Inositol polyphosphate 5-phosphatase OCRL [Lamellibrachia satsuma]
MSVPVMECQKRVQQLLSRGDKCISISFDVASLRHCFQLRDDCRENGILAIVEGGQGEHGLFIYVTKMLTSSNMGDGLRLHATLPVNPQFVFKIVSQPGTVTHGGIPLVSVCFSMGDQASVVELAKNDQVGVFFAELKRITQVESQNAGFGIISNAAWLDKYAETTPVTVVNPFLDDIFDPFAIKREALEGNNSMARSKSMQDFSDSGSFSDGCGLNRMSEIEDAIKRSYEKNLDDLDDADGLTASRCKLPSHSAELTDRETLVQLIMKAREEEFTEIKPYRVFCGTWNVNGQPPTESLHNWLQPREDMDPPDVYVIGFQELDLSKNAYIFDSVREEEWYKKVCDSLHSKAQYIRLKLVRLVGMMLIVFARTNIRKSIRGVRAGTIGTGIMGMMGNKGGVAVRFQLHNTTLCFVNSHLAAHTGEYERRNQDFRDISSKLNLGNMSPPMTISSHDIVFWIGDLNYRLNDIDGDGAKRLIQKGLINKLIEFDQLHLQKAANKVFLDYNEGKITFIPTYKYNTGTDVWDTSEKCRAPAWCDRILWRGPHVTQVVYRSHPSLKLSDHKPVSSIFDTGVMIVKPDLQRKVYEDVMKQADRLENEFLPKVSLDLMEISFANVKFRDRHSRQVTVTNTGQVPVKFQFINKLNEATFCKSWLKVEPSCAIVNVGATTKISLEVYVDYDTAPSLNSKKDQIEDVLIMHLKGGKDLFISVSGNFLPSCFGSSIEDLVQVFGPIRDVATAPLVDLEVADSITSRKDHPFDIPKELWRLIDHLVKYGMDQDSLFQQQGLHTDILLIRDALDTGSPVMLRILTLSPGSVDSIAEALCLFLESMAEPVIPTKHTTKCLAVCTDLQLSRQVLTELPKSHQKVFNYVCAFLREVLRHSHKNNLDAMILEAWQLKRPEPVTIFEFLQFWD